MKKPYCTFLLGLLICLMGSVNVQANSKQTERMSDLPQAKKTVTGTVADRNGEPMVGATIAVKGTSTVMATDVDGKFSLPVSEGDVLAVSFIGYTTKNVTIGTADTFTVTLEESAQMLDEIEITAEFGMKRVARSIGSSVQNVKATDIIDSGRDNFITALQGRVAGMNVVSSGGAPGASNTVILRSLTSISGNNQPLYVVDGIPMNNSSFNPSSGFARTDVYSSRYLDFSSRGDDFNPEDIESMTILKGAAAAALYGSNASNGAIIITTKKGAPGKGKVSYSNSFRWDTAYGIPEIQNKYANGGYGATNYYNGAKYGGLYPEDTQFYDNIDAVLQTGFTSRHNVAVEAGTASTTIRAAASFLDQTGIIKTTDYNRTNISLSGKSEITKWLKMEAMMQYTSTSNSKVQKGTSGPFRNAIRWPIIDDMSNYLAEDGMHMRLPERYVDSDLYNPLFGMYKNKFYDESDRIIANAVVIATPTKNTFVRAQVGWDVGAQTFETSEHPYFTTNNYAVLPGNGGVYNLSKSNFSDPTINFLAGYNDSFLGDKLTVSAQAGYHQMENGVTRLSTYGTKFAVVDLQSINNCDPTTVSSRKRASMRRIQAISGQAEIGWNNMAFLTLRARNDWSSTLPKENNSYFYPAMEGAFVATELPFLKNNKYVTYLKLRGALAQVGKDAGPLEINPELEATALSGGGYKYGWTGPNLDLRPEMTTSWEAGFEGRFFNDRVVADFTYFKTRCDDQIVKEFRMSYAGGFVLNTQNMGSFETWGWEAHIDGDIINTDGLRWNVGVNMSHTGSEVMSMPVLEYYDAYTNGNTAGIRNGVMVGYPVTTVTGTDFQRNDDGVVLIDPSTGIPLVSADWTVLADREPKLRFGFTTMLSYQGFRFSAMFAGKFGANVVNGTKRDMLDRGSSWDSVEFRESAPVVFNGVLKDGNENTDHPTPNTMSITYNDYSASIYTGAAANWIEKDINYIRLQELRLSYSIPPQYLRKFINGFVSHASVFVCGNDLFTITNYTGIDAVGNTVSASAGGTGGEGYDTWALPNPRGISFGVSLTFN
jgi:TonB-linked SusC/RagA family outer membrane protein